LSSSIKRTFVGSGWEVAEDAFPLENLDFRETVFSQGNGYLGLRGAFEEGLGLEALGSSDGTFLNGFYETGVISYGEKAYAFPEVSQTMLNVTNGKPVRIFLGGEPLDMRLGRVEGYRRTLDLRDGVLRREYVWTSPEGRKVSVRFERLVSFAEKNVAAIRCEIVPLNFSGTVNMVSALDGGTRNRACGDDPRMGSGLRGDAMEPVSARAGEPCSVTRRTKKSKLSVCCAASHAASPEGLPAEYRRADGLVGAEFSWDAPESGVITLEKFLCYADSRYYMGDGLIEAAESMASDARKNGFEALKAAQAEYLQGFWRAADVEIRGDGALQQGIRYNIFQLLQSAGSDGRTFVSSKGLSGEGYEGHYFWDTETYVLPFFLFTNPEVSRNLLMFRCNTLDRARRRAREMGHAKGALFPWRTINGDECSAYFPAGTAQYHINADIAHAVKAYAETTGDEEFLFRCGAETLFETARVWADLGHYNANRGGKFCINAVTGPDEYNAVVDNNCYTNLMAAENMRYAAETAARMQSERPGAYCKLQREIGLGEEEPAAWLRAADNIYIPFDEKRGIHLQDDGFLDRKPWDFEGTPRENYPLLLHYHPLVIYRHDVCKQADMVLASFLLGDRFDIGQKKRDFDFYERVATHDSSLSMSIFGVMACELGYRKKALEYFMRTARMDLDNVNGNTGDGIHTANMAGAWMGIVNGFAGMRAYGGKLSFHPFLPEGWEGYSFRVTYRGNLLKVAVQGDAVEYSLLEGRGMEFKHGDENVRLAKDGREKRPVC
jgi:trehalose/maltose hydrolase-like predicted phosphorylase